MKGPVTRSEMGVLWRQNVEELGALLPRLTEMQASIERAAGMLMDCFTTGGKALFAGNGGSAADAMHFAEELLVRFQKNRRALPAIALCDPTVLSCAANDFGYDSVFSRQVEGLGATGDLLVVMSTSGNSANLARAVEAARKKGMKTLAMLGKGGGALKGACDVELIVPSDVTHHVQEVHKMIYHAICQWIDTQVD